MFIIMKTSKWKLLIVFLCLCLISKAQFPVKSNIGGSTTENRVPGMLSADRAFRVPRVDPAASAATLFSGSLTYFQNRLYLSNGTTWSIVTDRTLSVQQPLSVTNDVLSLDTSSTFGVATRFYAGGGPDNFFFDATNRRLGIQTQTPQSILDVSSTTSGFLPPRMTKNQRDAITNKVAGMVVYQTDGAFPGLRVYNGSNWVRFSETVD